jgi:hypothetical protein
MDYSEFRTLASDYSYAFEALWKRHGADRDDSEYAGGRLLNPAFLLDLIDVPPPRRRFSEQDLLDALVVIRAMRVFLDHVEGSVLDRARKRGTTFSKLAAAMGLKSRQAAEQRCLKIQKAQSREEQKLLDNRRAARFGMDRLRSGLPTEWAILSLPRLSERRRQTDQ